MSLLNYFNDHFYRSDELCRALKISLEELQEWQDRKIFPNASFQLENKIQCSSFLGISDHKEVVEYYPRGFANWGNLILKFKIQSSSHAFECFAQVYMESLQQHTAYLSYAGETEFNERLEEIVKYSWQQFLSSKYGAVSDTGEVTEIAAIDYCKSVIDAITDDMSITELDEEQKMILHKTMKLLNKSLSQDNELFKYKSIREEYVHRLIKQYDLSVY